MTSLIIIIGLFVIITVIAALLKNRTSGVGQDFRYRLVHKFLSTAELSFFGVLRQAVGDKGVVFAKVRIADVITPKRGMGKSKWQAAFNKIRSKHFDFVICTSTDAKPVAAVELDDSSHNRNARIKRDNFVNRAAEAAALPLLRIPAKSAYSIADLKEQLAPHLELTAAPQEKTPAPVVEQSATSPTCPKCGSAMTRRAGKSGALAGKEFWGCQRYPRCRGVLPALV